jgi:hypothetical protein
MNALQIAEEISNLTEQEPEQSGINFGEPEEVDDGMREEEARQMMPEPEEMQQTDLDGLLNVGEQQPMM